MFMKNNLENNSILNMRISDLLWKLSLIFFFSIELNPDLRTYVLWYGSIIVLIASYLIKYKVIPFKLTNYTAWLFGFILLGCMSALWSKSTVFVMDVIKPLVVIFVVLYFINSKLSSKEDIEEILKCYVIAIFITCIYILTNIDLKEIGHIQIGKGVIEGWNGNAIGLCMASGAMISLYFVLITKTRSRVIYVLTSILFTYVVLYTGSRTSLIVLIAGIAVYVFLNNPKKIVRNTIIVIALLFVAYYLIMNVESLYNVLGVRFEGLFSMFSGDVDKADNSALLRETFIENGVQWFAEKPIIGYGLNNYKYLNRIATSFETYAHNTFIEIAVGLGIVGLIFYYSFYFNLIFKLYKKNNAGNDNKLNCFIIAVLVSSLIGQYGDVNYYSMYQNLIFCLACSIIYKVNAKKDTDCL